jgi:hypothetical protein
VAVAEYEEDSSPKPRAWEDMLRRIPPKNMEVLRVLPVGLHYWLKKRIGKREALRVASTLEKVILIFGREQIGDRI